VALILLPLLAGGVATAQDVAPIALAPASAAARAPRIKSVGGTTAVSWIETLPGGDDALKVSILFDALAPTVGSPLMFTMDVAAASSLGESDVAVDPATQRPAVLWIGDSGSETQVRFASPGVTPEIVFRTQRFLEIPVLDYDAFGNAYAAWTEVDGGTSRLHAAVRPAGGAWSTMALSDASRPYDVLPQIFGNAFGAELYWFSMSDDEVLAHLVMLDTLGVSADRRGTLSDVPANRLPTIYRATEEQSLGFLWLEQGTDGETYFDLDPRYSPEANPGVLGLSTSTVAEPAVSDDASAKKTWLETGADGEHRLVVRQGGGEENRLAISRTAREPVIAVSPKWTHIVWTEENLLDGVGSLYYLRFP